MVVRALPTPIHTLRYAVIGVVIAVIVVGIRVVVIGSLTEIPLRVLMVLVLVQRHF